MKKGVILVNCARGGLTDTEALIEGIESMQIGALGMDTAEGEEGIIHCDRRSDIIANRNWFYLHQFRNVIMTQHMAFYTEQDSCTWQKRERIPLCWINCPCDSKTE